MNILKSGIKIFIADTLDKILGFVAIIYFAQVLGPTKLGIFFLFQTLVGILSIFADLGIDDAVEKRLSEGNEKAKHLGAGILLKIATTTTICVGILIFKQKINEYLSLPLAFLLVIAIVVRQGNSTVTKILNGEERVGETAILKATYKTIWFGLGGLLLLNGFGVKGLVYSLLIGYSASFIFGLYKISTDMEYPSFEQIVSITRYSKYQFVSRAGGEVFNWMDLFLIGIFLTQTAVGQYEIAWRVTIIVILLSNSISTALFPKVSKWFEQGDIEKIEDKLPKLATISVVLVIPAFFGTVLYSKEILLYIFGQEYASAWVVLIILMVYKPFQAIQAIFGRSLLAIDKPGLAARATIVSVLLNIILNIFLIISFGLIGAALATVVSSLVSDSLHYRYLSRYINITIEIYKILWILVASIVMSIFLIGVNNNLVIDDAITLSLAVATGVLLYFGILILYGPIRKDLYNYTTKIRL